MRLEITNKKKREVLAIVIKNNFKKNEKTLNKRKTHEMIDKMTISVFE